MRLEFTYTAEDFIETQAAAVGQPEHEPRPKTFLERRGVLVGWVCFVFLAVFMFTLLQNNAAPAPPNPAPLPAPARPASNVALQWVLPAILWVLVFGFIWFFVFRQMRAARRIWESNPVLQQPKTLDLTDGGVRLSDALASTEWRWEAFSQLVETTNLFLLRQSDGTFLMIPKRGAPPGGLDALRAILAERMHEPGAFPVLSPKQP